MEYVCIHTYIQVYHSLPSQGSGIVMEEVRARVKRKWMTRRKQFLATAGQLHIRTHSIYGRMYKSRTNPKQDKSENGERTLKRPSIHS